MQCDCDNQELLDANRERARRWMTELGFPDAEIQTWVMYDCAELLWAAPMPAVPVAGKAVGNGLALALDRDLFWSLDFPFLRETRIRT